MQCVQVKKIRNTAIKLDSPKGSVILDRVPYEILPQMKMDGSQHCLYPQCVGGQHQSHPALIKKPPLENTESPPPARNKWRDSNIVKGFQTRSHPAATTRGAADSN